MGSKKKAGGAAMSPAPGIVVVPPVTKWILPPEAPKRPTLAETLGHAGTRRLIDDAITKSEAPLGALAPKVRAWLDDPARFSTKYDDDVQLAAYANVGRWASHAILVGWLEASDLTRALRLGLSQTRWIVGVDGLYASPSPEAEASSFYGVASTLSDLVARTPPPNAAELAATRAAIEPLLAGAHPAVEVHLARMLHDQRALDELARRLADDPALAKRADQVLFTLRALVAETRDAVAWEKLLLEHTRIPFYGGAKAIAPSLLHIPKETLVRTLGALLDKLSDKAHRCPPGDYKELVLIAACIDDRELARRIALRAHVKNLTAIVAEIFERMPQHLPALEEAAAQKGKVGEAARTVLESVRRKVDGAAAVAPAGATAKTPKGKAPRGKERAQPAKLPECLRVPPWDQPKATDAIPRRELAIPDAPATHLRPGEHLAWVARGTWKNTELLARFEREGADIVVPQYQYLEGLISHLGASAIPNAVAAAAKRPARFLELLLHVASPRAAVALATQLGKTAEAPRIRGWLLAHAPVAALGLVPAALSPDDAVREPARDAIAVLVAAGKRAAVEDAARPLGPEALAVIDRAVTAAAELPAPGKLPSFAKAKALPAPILRESGDPVDEATVGAMLRLLTVLPKDAPHPAARQLREAFTQESLDDFVWTLVSDWVLAGAKAREDWVLFAAGHLGSDAIARKIDDAIPKWVAKNVELMQKALDVLARMGTDVALSILFERGLAARFEDTQERVRDLLGEIAAQRGIDVAALEDRLVPELGLELGPIVLDYGTRKLPVKLDEHFEPYVVGGDGARLAGAPRLEKTDDAEKATRARERFATLQRDLAHVARSQGLRLERAMREARSWAADAWLRDVLGQPLMRLLATRIVWSTGVALFRVAEDGTLAGDDDASFTLDPSARVVVAHRLEADAAAWKRMATIFADYELISPFPQLARETFAPPAAAREWTGAKGRVVPWAHVMDLLTGRGWRRTPPVDGTVKTLVLPLDGRGFARAQASVTIAPGLTVGPVKAQPKQTLGPLVLEGDEVTFGGLGERFASELVRDVETL